MFIIETLIQQIVILSNGKLLLFRLPYWISILIYFILITNDLSTNYVLSSTYKISRWIIIGNLII